MRGSKNLKIGDHVIKSSGDYNFDGVIVSKFEKLRGAVRFVVENKDGLLFIFNESQLELFGKNNMTFDEKKQNWTDAVNKHLPENHKKDELPVEDFIYTNAVIKAIEEVIPYEQLEKVMTKTTYEIAQIFEVPVIVIVRAIEFYNGRSELYKRSK